MTAPTGQQGSNAAGYPWSAGTAPARHRAPPGAVDAHLHVYDSRFPPDPRSSLRPGDARVADYRAIQSRLGLSRCVVVQSSTYGTHNRCLVEALGQLGDDARGIAVVDPSCSRAELERLDAAGVRGLRFNLSQGGGAAVSHLEPIAAAIADLGWHVQLQATAEAWAEVVPVLHRLPVPVVIDHMGRLPQQAGLAHPSWLLLRKLVDGGRAWVKLSGAYLESPAGPPDYPDVAQVARAWIGHAPERLVWGTDWPHPAAHAGAMPVPDDAALFDLLVDWTGTESLLEQVLVANPCALYGFSLPPGARDGS